MLHVWYIYLQNWVMFRAIVGTYSINGAYGYIWVVMAHDDVHDIIEKM